MGTTIHSRRKEALMPWEESPGISEEPRDKAVHRRLDALVEAHSRLRELSLSLAVRGGVVHVRGTVPSDGDLTLMRNVFSSVRGVHGIWDIVKAAGGNSVRIVELGCGGKKQVPGAVGVDKHPYPGVDICADLEGRLPFRDGEADHVFAVHVLEHIRNLLGLMNEIHRILAPQGILHVLVPNARCVNAVADPTHVRLFDKQTIKFFCRSCPELAPFRPVCISSDEWTVYADLMPVARGETLASEEELAYFFD